MEVRFQRFAIMIFIGLILSFTCADAQCEGLMVSAAASLTDAFKEIGTAFEKQNPEVKVEYNFASSGTLATQIEQGAPVDVFASASETDMDRLQTKGLVIPQTRKAFAGNSLVVITHQSSHVTIRSLDDLKKDTIKLIAIGNPETTPGGRYAMQAFKAAHIDAANQSKLVYGSDIRQVRSYVAGNEVDAAVVFSTDSNVDNIKIAYHIPEKMHQKIVYPAAVVSDSKNPQLAKRFIDFLISRNGRKIMSSYGFKRAGK